MTKLIASKTELENKLKASYCDVIYSSEIKAVNDIKKNPGRFFAYAKARQKTQTKIGPFINPETGVLEPDPDYSAKILSDQYSSVFNQPRSEWIIPDLEEFFKVDSVQLSGDLLSDVDFTEDDIKSACDELSPKSAAGPDGIPASMLKTCKKELKRPLYILWSASMRQGVIPPELLLVLVCPIHKGGSKVEPSQYRPVALTSHVIKVFERVLR